MASTPFKPVGDLLQGSRTPPPPIRQSWQERCLLGILILVMLAPGSAQGGDAPGAWVDSMAIPDQAITHMSAFADGSAFVWMHNRPRSIYVSDDYGLTFTVKEAPAEYGSGFEMMTPEVGYFLRVDRLFMTEDGADSWARLPMPEIPGTRSDPSNDGEVRSEVIVQGVTRLGTSPRIAFGGQIVYVKATERVREGECDESSSHAAVFLTKDGGRSGRYRVTKLPFPGTVDRLGFLNERVGWVLATEMESSDEVCGQSNSVRNVVMLTFDGGKTYREAHSCPHSGEGGIGFDSLACTSVAMSSRRKIIIGKSDGWIYVSTNGGFGFEQYQRLVPPGTDELRTHWVSGIEFANAAVGYAVAKGGGTYRTDDGGLTWNFEPSSQTTWGVGIGDIAVADAEHAIAGGPNSIITRLPN